MKVTCLAGVAHTAPGRFPTRSDPLDPRPPVDTRAPASPPARRRRSGGRPATLAAVPVIRECDETGGDIAVSRLDPPTIYICRRVVELVRKSDPGVEHFYLVHEYGHIALQTSDEAAADCWAARELAKAPNGERYLAATIRHFRRRGEDPSRRYGTPLERAERIRSCAEAPG